MGEYDRDEVLRLFREYEFRSLIERLPALSGEQPREPGALLRAADAGGAVPAAIVPGRELVRRPAGLPGAPGGDRDGSGLQLTLDFDALAAGRSGMAGGDGSGAPEPVVRAEGEHPAADALLAGAGPAAVVEGIDPDRPWQRPCVIRAASSGSTRTPRHSRRGWRRSPSWPSVSCSTAPSRAVAVPSGWPSRAPTVASLPPTTPWPRPCWTPWCAPVARSSATRRSRSSSRTWTRWTREPNDRYRRSRSPRWPSTRRSRRTSSTPRCAASRSWTSRSSGWACSFRRARTSSRGTRPRSRHSQSRRSAARSGTRSPRSRSAASTRSSSCR